MDLSQLNLLNFFAGSFVVKAIEFALVALFAIYALVTIREVSLMNQTIRTVIRTEVQLIAYLQLALAIVVLAIIFFN